MPLFPRKTESFEMPQKKNPVELVLQMKQQGMSNNQIIQTLQLDGFKSYEIFDAMNQADLKGNVQSVGAGMTRETEPENPAVIQPPYEEQYQSYEAPHSEGLNKEQIEEIIEPIIEEKWSEVMNNVKKIVQWKDSIEKEIEELKNTVSNLEKNFSELHKGVLGRVNDYDSDIKEMGTDIKALNKVFEKILPTLTDNVNELGSIAAKMKKK